MTAVCAAFRLDFNASDPYARFLQGLTAIDGLVAKDRLTRAMNLKDLPVAHDLGRPAIIQSIEGAHFLEGHLERVEEVYKRGSDSDILSSRPGQSTNAAWPGQTGGFFKAAVAEMLRQGFTPAEIGKVGGGNFCRVFDKVTTGRV